MTRCGKPRPRGTVWPTQPLAMSAPRPKPCLGESSRSALGRNQATQGRQAAATARVARGRVPQPPSSNSWNYGVDTVPFDYVRLVLVNHVEGTSKARVKVVHRGQPTRFDGLSASAVDCAS